MTEKNKNLLIRLITAFSLLPIVIYVNHIGGYALAALLGVAAVICVYEYALMMVAPPGPLVFVVGLFAFIAPFSVVAAPTYAPLILLVLTGLTLAKAWTWHLFFGPRDDAPARSAQFVVAFIYGTFGLTSLMGLRQLPLGEWWILLCLCASWGNDTGAYAGGRLLGRHKLFPAVSPNKTWEGFFGGFVGAFMASMVLRVFFAPDLPMRDLIVFSILCSLFGPLGDLSESMLKRARGVKESGGLIPGHGGMLDRIDSLIYNAPAVLAYVYFAYGR